MQNFLVKKIAFKRKKKTGFLNTVIIIIIILVVINIEHQHKNIVEKEVVLEGVDTTADVLDVYEYVVCIFLSSTSTSSLTISQWLADEAVVMAARTKDKDRRRSI